MSKGKFVKLPRAEMAGDLLENTRTTRLLKVMVRSTNPQQGYWGRGWSVQTALRAAKWLTRGDEVQVFLCSKDARCGEVSGGLSQGLMSDTIYRGKVHASGDVKVTHRWVPDA